MRFGNLLLKNFQLTNAVGLTLLGFMFWVKDTGDHTLPWWGSYFLSLFLLSTGLSYFTCPLRSIKVITSSSIFFAILHWVFTGVFTIILERFFRLPEHYSFSVFDLFLHAHWSLLIDGLLWFALYIIWFHLIKTHVKLEATRALVEKQEKELTQSDLNTLRKEINPHFLFNAMNSIAMKVRLKENKTAVSMIAALNDLLRLSLSSRSGQKLVTVKEELDLLQKYLLIERYRFGDNVRVILDFPDDTQKALLPELILQPLVENAFKHGMNSDVANGKIKIAGRKVDDGLELTIFNTQESDNSLLYKTSGIGLPNTINRLKSLYGTRFRFQSLKRDNGVMFKINIPFQT